MATVTNYGTLGASSNEQTLGATRTDGKTYVLQVDLSNMVAGDVVEIRTKVKVLTGSTERTLYRANFAGVQGYPVVQTPPIPAPYSITFTLKQSAGTNRNFDYALISLD